MKHLSFRLFLSHLAVALVGGLVTFVLVRLLVPRLSDEAAHGLRSDQSPLIGVIAGAIAAVLIGLIASWRLLRPLREMQRATRQLAAGDCHLQVERPDTTDLSTLSRVEEGQLQLELAEVNLADVVKRTVSRIEPRFDEAGVRLHTLMSGRFDVRADADRLGQVIAGLLGNALRATRDRSGGEVLVGVARKTDNGRPVARVTVTDNGVGLSEDELGKIFERFYRAPSARGTEGSGIGFTIARDIVRAHGGELVANSPGPGRGATLTLTVPLVSSPVT